MATIGKRVKPFLIETASKENQETASEENQQTKRHIDQVCPVILICFGVLLLAAFIVVIAVVPDMLAQDDVSPWALYVSCFTFIPCATLCCFFFLGPNEEPKGSNYLSCPGSSHTLRGSKKFIICEQPVLQLIILVSFAIVIPVGMVGVVWYAGHRVPYARLMQADALTGDIVATSFKLMKERSSMSQEQTPVYFRNGFVDEAQMVSTKYESSSVTGGDTSGSNMMAPVYESSDRGKVLGWALPLDEVAYDQAEDSSQINADTCTEAEQALGGLCGVAVRNHHSYVSNYQLKVNSELLSLWVTRHGDSVQWALQAEHSPFAQLTSTNRGEDRSMILRELPVFVFASPSKQSDRIAFWMNIGLAILIVCFLSTCLALSSTFIAFIIGCSEGSTDEA